MVSAFSFDNKFEFNYADLYMGEQGSVGNAICGVLNYVDLGALGQYFTALISFNVT